LRVEQAKFPAKIWWRTGQDFPPSKLARTWPFLRPLSLTMLLKRRIRQADEAAHQAVGGVGVAVGEDAWAPWVLPGLAGVGAGGVPAPEGVIFVRCPVAAGAG
jgi:hypothetical protein